jgi:hypothetical protein
MQKFVVLLAFACYSIIPALDATASNLLTKTTEVYGESLPVFSIDGERWFSDPRQPAERERRSKEFFKREAGEIRRHFDAFSDTGIANPTVYQQCPELEPEYYLWLAVVQEAVRDARSDSERLRRTALNWFMSNGREVGGFGWVAELLGLDPAAVREALGLR